MKKIIKNYFIKIVGYFLKLFYKKVDLQYENLYILYPRLRAQEVENSLLSLLTVARLYGHSYEVNLNNNNVVVKIINKELEYMTIDIKFKIDTYTRLYRDFTIYNWWSSKLKMKIISIDLPKALKEIVMLIGE